MKEIAKALVQAQANMGNAHKNSKNPHFKSSYADLSSVMDACIPALNAAGIAVIQPTIERDGQRYVDTVFIHGESGEEMRCSVPLIVQKNDMQGYGSAVTYARRYGLMTMAGIAPEDDDGNAASKAAPPPFNAQAAAGRIIAKLSGATSIEDLKARWNDEQSVIAEIKAASVNEYNKVNSAKDNRKNVLEATNTTKPADDLGGDEIPEFGASK